MDRLPKKAFSKMPSPPTVSPGVVEPIPNKNIMATVSKWVPLICAGSAIGISIFALKEIKNTRKELMNLKKEQYTAPNNDKLEKKMELLEKQLNKITEFLKTNQQQQARYSSAPPRHTQHVKTPEKDSKQQPSKDPKIVKNVVNVVPEQVKIINEPPQDDADEYEEVEVTDDDEPDN